MTDLDDVNKTPVPPLSIESTHQYFIKRRVHKDQITASKPFECGYCIYVTKKVQLIAIYSPIDDILLQVIECRR